MHEEGDPLVGIEAAVAPGHVDRVVEDEAVGALRRLTRGGLTGDGGRPLRRRGCRTFLRARRGGARGRHQFHLELVPAFPEDGVDVLQEVEFLELVLAGDQEHAHADRVDLEFGAADDDRVVGGELRGSLVVVAMVHQDDEVVGLVARGSAVVPDDDAAEHRPALDVVNVGDHDTLGGNPSARRADTQLPAAGAEEPDPGIVKVSVSRLSPGLHVGLDGVGVASGLVKLVDVQFTMRERPAVADRNRVVGRRLLLGRAHPEEAHRAAWSTVRQAQQQHRQEHHGQDADDDGHDALEHRFLRNRTPRPRARQGHTGPSARPTGPGP